MKAPPSIAARRQRRLPVEGKRFPKASRAVVMTHGDASAMVSIVGKVAVVTLAGRLDANTLAWLLSDVRTAGVKFGAAGTVIDATKASIDLNLSDLTAHAKAEALAVKLLNRWEPVAWQVPATEVDLFRDYAWNAAQLGVLRGSFAYPATRKQPDDPLEWVAREVWLSAEDGEWCRNQGSETGARHG